MIKEMVSQLCAKGGTLFIPEVEMIYGNIVVAEPWVGVIHQTPKNNCPSLPDLERLVKDRSFTNSLKACKGLFVLSSIVKEYLAPHFPDVPLCLIHHPITPFNKDFKFSVSKFEDNPKKKVLFIGERLRNFQAIFDLQVPNDLQKVLIKGSVIDLNDCYGIDKKKIDLKQNETVNIWEKQISDEDYDQLLSENVVFLNLFDVAACTTVIECLGRGTPLVINRLPGAEEYLGKDYPLFYSTLEEASHLLANKGRLMEGHEYLMKRIHEIDLSEESFFTSIVNSAIYRHLPLPRSQQHCKERPNQCIFPEYDVTFIIYVTNLRDIDKTLQGIRAGRNGRTVQLLLWSHDAILLGKVRKVIAAAKEDITCYIMEASEQYNPSCVYKALKELADGDVTVVVDSASVFQEDTFEKLVEEDKDHMMYISSDTIRQYQNSVIPPMQSDVALPTQGDFTLPTQGDITLPTQDGVNGVKTFDVSIVMCQYKRVKDLPELLRRLEEQNFEGTFQLIIWNNNEEMKEEIKDKCKPFMKKLNIELIHSSKNFYCGIRFAIKDLIKSDLIILIDDDILPGKGYVKRFIDKYKEYGPNTTFSFRGHLFNHSIDEENPQEAWQYWYKSTDQFLQLEQHHEDHLVHMHHAGNMLIPKQILEAALSGHQLTRRDYVLVDDYWLSFVLSHHMEVSLMRVKADDVMAMTPSADDEEVALYCNRAVHEQRADFYIYHNRLNWPKSKPIEFPNI